MGREHGEIRICISSVYDTIYTLEAMSNDLKTRVEFTD